MLRWVVCLCLCTLGISPVWAEQTTLDFKQINGFDQWGSSYASHTVEYPVGTVTFASANRQNGTITDVPVTMGNDVTFVMKEGSTLKALTLTCRPWGSKAQTITLHTSTDGGSDYESKITSSNFKLTADTLPPGTNAVKFTFSSGKNQIGIESLAITYTTGVDGSSPVQHTVTFVANGQTVSSTSMEEGSPITFDALDATYVPEGKTFRGWTTATVSGMQQTAPDMVSQATVGTADVTYYAVFATASTSGSAAWQRKSVSEVVANPDPDGTYALITPDGHAFNGTISNGHGQVTQQAFVFDNGLASTAPEGVCELTVIKNGNGILIKIKGDSLYVYARANKSKNLALGKTPYVWNDQKGNLCQDGNKAYLRSFENSSIRTYSNVGNGDALYFAYKPSMTYVDYCTNVDTSSPRTTQVTVADCGYTTICLPFNAIAAEGAQIYALHNVAADELIFVPKDTAMMGYGYIVAGQAGETYTLTEVLESGIDTDNLLQGVVKRTVVSALGLQGEGDYAYPWILAKDGTFKRYVGEFIPAGKAYLDGFYVQVMSQGASAMRITFAEEDVTGLQSLSDARTAPAVYYTLDGRRVQQPRSGRLCIDRDRKIIIR
ncbi:MAG: InlB B-repeat-containing protein [Bacteroidales bacterium]|nr:InlB B-repeat-containing protein [Bacteroidales bacterium]